MGILDIIFVLFIIMIMLGGLVGMYDKDVTYQKAPPYIGAVKNNTMLRQYITPSKTKTEIKSSLLPMHSIKSGIYKNLGNNSS